MRFLILLAALMPPFQEETAPSVERLIEMLRSDRAGERDEGARRLYETGEKAIPLLQEAARSGDPEVRARARAVLDRLERDRQEREGNARAARLPEFWPGGRYDVLVEGRRAVSWSFRNEKVKRGGREFLRLRISVVPSETDRQSLVDLITRELGEWAEEYLCEANRTLTPVEARIGLEAPPLTGDPPGPGKIRLNERIMEAPAGGILGGPPAHVATLMPQEKGAEWTFHAVDFFREDLRRIVLRCEGREEITLGGKTLKAWRFVDHAPPREGELPRPFRCWIGEDRRLLRTREGYYELILSGAP